MSYDNSSNWKRIGTFYKAYRRVRYIYHLKRSKRRKLKEERDEAERKENEYNLEYKKTLRQHAIDNELRRRILENKLRVQVAESEEDLKITDERTKEIRRVLKEVAEQREIEEERREKYKELERKKRPKRKSRSKSSFNIFYRSYRIIRYLRYLKKLQKLREKEKLQKEINERKEFTRTLREQKVDTGVWDKILENKSRIAPDGDYKVYRIKEEVNDELISILREVAEKEMLEDEARRKEKLLQRRKMIMDLIKQSPLRFKNALLGINKQSIIEAFKKLKEEKNKELIIIIANSTSFFLLAYLAMFFIYQLTSAIATTFFDFDVIMYYEKNEYLLEPDEWTFDSVKTIYSSGPLVSIIIASFSTIIYFQIREQAMKAKLFFLWLSFHGFTMFFGGLLIGTLFSKGFGHVLIWSYVMDTGKLVVSLFSISVLIGIGLYLTRGILISSNSYFKHLNASNRKRFVMGQILYPYIIGNLIMLLFWLPEFNVYFQLVLASVFFLLTPVLFRNDMFNDLFFDGGADSVKYNYIIIAIALIIIVIYRIVFEFGIRIS